LRMFVFVLDFEKRYLFPGWPGEKTDGKQL